jgi:hypothetical protein
MKTSHIIFVVIVTVALYYLYREVQKCSLELKMLKNRMRNTSQQPITINRQMQPKPQPPKVVNKPKEKPCKLGGLENILGGGLLPSLLGTVGELMSNKEEPKRKNTLFPTIEDEDSDFSEEESSEEESSEEESSEEDSEENGEEEDNGNDEEEDNEEEDNEDNEEEDNEDNEEEDNGNDEEDNGNDEEEDNEDNEEEDNGNDEEEDNGNDEEEDNGNDEEEDNYLDNEKKDNYLDNGEDNKGEEENEGGMFQDGGDEEQYLMLKGDFMESLDTAEYVKNVLDSVDNQVVLGMIDIPDMECESSIVITDGCQHIIKKGSRVGQPCGKKLKNGNYCRMHC